MTTQMHFHPWTQEQSVFLSKNYMRMDLDEMSAALHRTRRAVRAKANSMRLYRCERLTSDDLQLIEALNDSGMARGLIAKKFDISENQLKQVMNSPQFSCDICGLFSVSKRSAYWQFSGEDQRVFNCCPACSLAMVESFNAGNDVAIEMRRGMPEKNHRLGAA